VKYLIVEVAIVSQDFILFRNREMKTKIRALLEELCGDDYPEIVEQSNAVVPMREMPFPNAGLTIMDNFIEISKDAKKLAEPIISGQRLERLSLMIKWMA